MNRFLYLLSALCVGAAGCADTGARSEPADRQTASGEPFALDAATILDQGTARGSSDGDWSSAGFSTLKIPLCAGLTIVTAVREPDGDYESIKTIESVDEREVKLRYSAELPTRGLTLTRRSILREDLESANAFLPYFGPEMPLTVPGTTALGTSTNILRSLKEVGAVELSFLTRFSGSSSLDRSIHPNLYDGLVATRIQRVGSAPVTVSLMVNDAQVKLPAIHARAIVGGDSADFFFLDDAANPLALSWRIPARGSTGIGELVESSPEIADLAKVFGIGLPGAEAKQFDELRVVKLSHRCGDVEAAGGEGGGTLERALAETGRAEVYDIFFAFNSDEIRAESESRLAEIAEVLQRHPEWRLRVEGHTDGIGSENANLELSRLRAAAVKTTLVRRYGIDAARLSPVGHGASQPRDSNETLEGRARNRRVELVRQ